MKINKALIISHRNFKRREKMRRRPQYPRSWPKRILPLAVILAMTALSLAGCGSKEYANDYDEIEELTPSQVFFEGKLAYDAAAEKEKNGSTNAYDTSYTIIKNADVRQVAGDEESPTAVVIKDDVIEYVGSDDGAVKYDNGDATVIDADGRTVMPGMVEAHMHGSSMSIGNLYEINLVDIQNEKEMLDIIADFISNNPGLNVYSGSGWDVSVFGSTGPVKEKLDLICDDTPVILKSADGHSTWVNSKAIENAGITAETKADGGTVVIGDDGEPQGYLKESAANLVADQKPVYTAEQMKSAVEWLQDYLLSQGFTTFFNAGMSPDGDENYYTALEEMAEAGELKVNVRASWWVQPYNFDSWEDLKAYLDRCREIAAGFETEYFQANTIKLMCDQVLEEATAYMEYYKDPEDHTSDKELKEDAKLWGGKEDMLEQMFAYAADSGMQIHIHQIGDPAAEYILDSLEKVNKEHPQISENTVAFAHCQFLTEETQKRMAELNITAVTAPYWAVIDDYYWDVYEPLVGLETLQTQYPMKSLLDEGINVAFHSDSPVTMPNMGWLYYSALTRTLPQKIFNLWYGEDSEEYVRVTDADAPQGIEDIEKVYGGRQVIAPLLPSEERLTLEETIKASTYGGAYSLRMQDSIGSIEKGKKANILILDQDLSSWKLK